MKREYQDKDVEDASTSKVAKKSSYFDETGQIDTEDSMEEGGSINPIVHQDSSEAFNGHIKTQKFTVESSDIIADAQIFLDIVRQKVLVSLKGAIDNCDVCIKFTFKLHGLFIDNIYNEFNIGDTFIFYKQDSDMFPESVYLHISETIVSQSDILYSENPGQKQLLFFELSYYTTNVSRYDDSSSYLEVPNHISPYVDNIKKMDNCSFKWAVLAALNTDQLNLNGIKHPVKLSDIPKIEDMNEVSFNVFVLNHTFATQRKEIEGPVYHTKFRRQSHVNLLLLQDEVNMNCKWHYCLIKDLNKIVDPDKSGPLCDGCLCFFDNEYSLKEHHTLGCFNVKAVLPSNDELTLKFINNNKDKALPLVVYADFEAVLDPVANVNTLTMAEKKNQLTYTKNVSRHCPYSFAFYVKCATNDNLSCLKTYHVNDLTDHTCENEFIKQLKTTLESLISHFQDTELIPVFFHNFKGYDSHFVIKGLHSLFGNVGAMGNKCKYEALYKTLYLNTSMGNRKIELRFLDSYMFLKGSIENLAKSLSKEEFQESFRYWTEFLPADQIDEEAFEMLTQKGVFPYEYITSLNDLKKTSLPDKKYFYDNLKRCDISDEDYQNALRVWKKFQCKTILQYAEIYLKSDVLLLADLFENLRRTCLRIYELDPAQYFSASGLSWDAMLKKTKVKLELLTDVNMLSFLKKGMRGGLAQCNHRHAMANNKYLPSTHDKKQKNRYLMYYDANNLYGWAMSQPLPYQDFEWVISQDEIRKFQDSSFWKIFPTDSEVGYFLDVDLEYPKEKKIHDRHADLPFCPEKKQVTTTNEKRLVTDLTSKVNYVLHHSYLIQCLKYGLVLKKVSRVLKFKQKPWMKPYIDFNTDLRAAATTEAEKNFYKNMNNSVFGKMITNKDNYNNVKIFTHWWTKGQKRGGHNALGKPEYHSHAIISDGSIAVQYNKTKCKYDYPTYAGIGVLDLAKSFMYDFHYGFMKQKYGANLKLLYTDTDSLIYEICTEDFYTDMRDSLKDRFDTSDYIQPNQFGYPPLNKKKLGYFKDEFNGAVVEEFVALRPKVYAIVAGGKLKKTAASAPNVVRDEFTIDDYKKCLTKNEALYKEYYAIKAVDNEIYTQRIRKAVLNATVHNKRHALNNIDSLPFGHYSIVGDDIESRY